MCGKCHFGDFLCGGKSFSSGDICSFSTSQARAIFRSYMVLQNASKKEVFTRFARQDESQLGCKVSFRDRGLHGTCGSFGARPGAGENRGELEIFTGGSRVNGKVVGETWLSQTRKDRSRSSRRDVVLNGSITCRTGLDLQHAISHLEGHER